MDRASEESSGSLMFDNDNSNSNFTDWQTVIISGANNFNEISSEGNLICTIEEVEILSETSANNSIDKDNSGPGRHFDKIWSKFSTIKDPNGKITSNKCSKCKKEVSPKAPRMKAHWIKCSSEILDVEKSSTKSKNEPTSLIIKNALTCPNQQSINKYISKLSVSDKEKLDKQFGRFLFSSNLSFNTLESNELKKFINMINPSYKLPTRRKIGGNILEEVYKEVIVEMKSEIKGKVGVLMQDGWTTNQNEQVISHCLCTEFKTYFLMSESPGPNSANASLCFELLKKALTIAEEDFECKIVGVVTDNCATMNSMKKIVNKYNSEIYTYGCNAHLLNLVMKKITPTDLIQKINMVQVYMKTHHNTSAVLKEINVNRPILPVATRWNSQIDCLLNYKENHTRYLDVLRKIGEPANQKDKEKYLSVKDIVENSAIYPQIKSTVKVLTPICMALDKVQRDKCNLADAARCWIDLNRELPESVTSFEYYKKQKDLALPKFALAAYILSPRYKGEHLDDTTYDEILNWLSSIDPLYVIYPKELKKKQSKFFHGSFMHKEVIKSLNDADWWSSATTALVSPKFLELVKELFILPASTGFLERSFSTLGKIMSKQRNRISLEKASKLCVINNQLKVMSEDVVRKNKKRKLSESSDENDSEELVYLD